MILAFNPIVIEGDRPFEMKLTVNHPMVPCACSHTAAYGGTHITSFIIEQNGTINEFVDGEVGLQDFCSLFPTIKWPPLFKGASISIKGKGASCYYHTLSLAIAGYKINSLDPIVVNSAY